MVFENIFTDLPLQTEDEVNALIKSAPDSSTIAVYSTGHGTNLVNALTALLKAEAQITANNSTLQTTTNTTVASTIPNVGVPASVIPQPTNAVSTIVPSASETVPSIVTISPSVSTIPATVNTGSVATILNPGTLQVSPSTSGVTTIINPGTVAVASPKSTTVVGPSI